MNITDNNNRGGGAVYHLIYVHRLKKMTKKNTNKTKSKAFFPNSPTSVGSPRRDGFYKRTVRQRTPHKLCSLILPSPLTSLFDSSTTSTTRQQQTVTTSDNVSIDGYSTTIDNVSQTPTQIRHSSNISAVSASVMSTKSSAHNSLKLPQHLRVGISPCDPLIVFDGRFVLVGTSDGRIAVYSVLDFDNVGGISDDVLASERRRQEEWVEEEAEGEEKKDFETSLDTDDEDKEEHEWDMRDRMQQRQRAKENVEPILVMTLPNMKQNQSKSDHQNLNQVKSSSYDEESTLASAGNSIFSPPTIVSMCATPNTGTNLLEKRETNSTKTEQNAIQIHSNSVVPSFVNILGQIAVLTGCGDVHLFEFLQSPGGEEDTNEISDVPIVNSILSFNTGYLGATCIYMHKILTNDKQQMRLSVGHQCGILTTFQIYSELITRNNVESPKRQGHERRNTHSSPEAISRLTAQSNAASRVLFQRGSDGNKKNESNLESKEIIRTLSEPIETSSQLGLDSSFGHAKVLLCLEGAFNVPIKSISSAGWGEVSENGALLVVGLEQRQREDASNQVSMNGLGLSLQHHSLSPTISLEVINTTLAQEVYAAIKGETESSSRKIITLQDYSVWPASGKEIKDGWMRSGKRKGIDPRDKLFSALQRTSVTNKICKSIHTVYVLLDVQLCTNLTCTYPTSKVALKDLTHALFQPVRMELFLYHIVT